MRRTIDQAFDALRTQITAWARGDARPDLRVFVYPPEWEPVMLSKMPAFAACCAEEGEPVDVVDLGQGFLHELRGRTGTVERLEGAERDELLHDLGWIGMSYLRRALRDPLVAPKVCRILVNSGALGTFVSYSAVANEM